MEISDVLENFYAWELHGEALLWKARNLLCVISGGEVRKATWEHGASRLAVGESKSSSCPCPPSEKRLLLRGCFYHEDFASVSKWLGSAGESCLHNHRLPCSRPRKGGQSRCGGVTKWDRSAGTGIGRAAVLDLTFQGADGRNTAMAGTYTPPCRGLPREKLPW